MATIDWKKNFVRNALSSYASTFCSLVLGLFMFRYLFGSWHEAEFGFWVLMWSIFGFGVVLDLGLGISVQRTIAEKAATGDADHMNRVVATVFWSFAIMSAGIFLVGILVRDPLLLMLKIPPDYHGEISRAFLIFAAGLTLLFPFGIFAEMLQGIQRLDLTNWIRAATAIGNFIAVGGAVALGFRFSNVILVAMVMAIVPGLLSAWFSFRHIEGLSLHPRHFDWRQMKSQLRFSLSAYFVTVSDRVIQQSDRLIVGSFLGVGSVALYQSAAKIGEMLRFAALHIEEMLSPAASHLRACDDTAGLRDLLMRGSRFNFVFVTPLYLLAAVYLDPLIRLLTGLPLLPRETWWIGQLLLFSIYNAQISINCARSVLVMSGHEKSLFRICLLQALTNVALSIAFVGGFGTLGVAAGTVASSVLFGWFVIVPTVLRTLKIGFGEYIGFHFQGVMPGFAIFGLMLIPLIWFIPIATGGSLIFAIAWRGIVIMAPTLLFNYRVLRTTWREV
jgi:O-antigen/teichoic acid export membrane protein